MAAVPSRALSSEVFSIAIEAELLLVHKPEFTVLLYGCYALDLLGSGEEYLDVQLQAQSPYYIVDFHVYTQAT
jgi:hypothetical protein